MPRGGNSTGKSCPLILDLFVGKRMPRAGYRSHEPNRGLASGGDVELDGPAHAERRLFIWRIMKNQSPPRRTRGARFIIQVGQFCSGPSLNQISTPWCCRASNIAD